MDPAHEIQYDMPDKSLEKTEPSFSHEYIRQLATNTADISHIKEQISDVKGKVEDLGEIRNSVAEVKTDMKLMSSGVNASIASLESKIDVNNDNFSWMRKLIFGLMFFMLSTTGAGLFVNNQIQKKNIKATAVSDSLRIDRILQEIKKELKKSIKK